jgi:hypothetical protein
VQGGAPATRIVGAEENIRAAGFASPVADFRKATEFKPGIAFATTPHAVARSRIDQRVRGNSWGGKNDRRCP